MAHTPVHCLRLELLGIGKGIEVEVEVVWSGCWLHSCRIGHSRDYLCAWGGGLFQDRRCSELHLALIWDKQQKLLVLSIITVRSKRRLLLLCLWHSRHFL